MAQCSTCWVEIEGPLQIDESTSLNRCLPCFNKKAKNGPFKLCAREGCRRLVHAGNIDFDVQCVVHASATKKAVGLAEALKNGTVQIPKTEEAWKLVNGPKDTEAGAGVLTPEILDSWFGKLKELDGVQGGSLTMKSLMCVCGHEHIVHPASGEVSPQCKNNGNSCGCNHWSSNGDPLQPPPAAKTAWDPGMSQADVKYDFSDLDEFFERYVLPPLAAKVKDRLGSSHKINFYGFKFHSGKGSTVIVVAELCVVDGSGKEVLMMPVRMSNSPELKTTINTMKIIMQYMSKSVQDFPAQPTEPQGQRLIKDGVELFEEETVS